ncbi:hypothetical protein WG66_002310 [Moniliophthora roreri]|nr:hypothetical protein WG66_002310 [Moniliophthora roreri]
MVSYTRILLIGLVFVQASLAKNSKKYFSCRCTNAERHWDNTGTEEGCVVLRKRFKLRPASIRTFKDEIGTVTWLLKESALGSDWDTWWTHYVCIIHQKLNSGQCWWSEKSP